MEQNRRAFTMIELIFVIVILGILASVAISKLALTRDDAIITKGRSQVSAIRNAIVLTRNQMLLQGRTGWPNRLDHLSSDTSSDGDPLFDANGTGASDVRLLDYPVYAKDQNGHWKKVASNRYAFKMQDTDVRFDYSATTGSFDCNRSASGDEGTLCKKLTQ